jgi:hypothetical protein
LSDVSAGLTFVTVATGLLLESGDLRAASDSVDLATAAAANSQLLPPTGARDDARAAVVAAALARRRSIGELSLVALAAPTSRAARRAHRPRGPPGS